MPNNTRTTQFPAETPKKELLEVMAAWFEKNHSLNLISDDLGRETISLAL